MPNLQWMWGTLVLLMRLHQMYNQTGQIQPSKLWNGQGCTVQVSNPLYPPAVLHDPHSLHRSELFQQPPPPPWANSFSNTIMHWFLTATLTEQVIENTTIQPPDHFYQSGMRSAPGWSYSYIVISCLSVCPSVHGLGRPQNDLKAAAGTNGCFELAGSFASSLQKEAKWCQYYWQ